MMIRTAVLLAGAGFMMRSFLNMYRQELGFDTSRLVTASYILPNAKYVGRDVRVGNAEMLQRDCRSGDLPSDVRREPTDAG